MIEEIVEDIWDFLSSVASSAWSHTTNSLSAPPHNLPHLAGLAFKVNKIRRAVIQSHTARIGMWSPRHAAFRMRAFAPDRGSQAGWWAAGSTAAAAWATAAAVGRPVLAGLQLAVEITAAALAGLRPCP